MKKKLELAIKMAGGQHSFARICGITQASVNHWLNRNQKKNIPSRLPAEYVLKVEKALKGKVTRYELRPDIYPKD